jgi:diadenosine tetraphosphate (Ap4A) HIT family hydrolase
MVERCRAADLPTLVTRLRSGWVVMGEKQVFPGYCLLLPDPVVPHLNELMFGNQEPALHAHIFPRFADEPAASRGVQPWAVDWNLAPDFSQLMYGDLQCRIAEKLESD